MQRFYEYTTFFNNRQLVCDILGDHCEKALDFLPESNDIHINSYFLQDSRLHNARCHFVSNLRMEYPGSFVLSDC
ncbi:hypothetical protein JCM10914A_25590 [Paenibacillus sp. JCM 10914]|nr:hypothetical protein JCM10914_5919 [Paenibacillus sp. JCM 10914]